MSGTATDYQQRYPAKYRELIDDDTWRFIEKAESFYPVDTATRTIDQQRSIYDDMCRGFACASPAGVISTDIAVPGSELSVSCRHYELPDHVEQTSELPVILYLHGGGFVVGSLESHDSVCAELCAQTGLSLLSVDYRLSPEHVHPAAFDDSLLGYRWVQETLRKPVILCGDSAGGNLAAAIAHHVRGELRQPLGQVLIYPGLGGNTTQGSYLAHAHAPMLTLADIEFYRTIRTQGKEISVDPSLAPLHDEDFTGLPPTVVISAECDPLSDDGPDYAERINQAGGDAVAVVEKGLVHGYLRARHESVRARDSFSRIVEALTSMNEGS